jgi:hypothetical protein
MTDKAQEREALIAAYRQGYREAGGQETDLDESSIAARLDSKGALGLQGAHMIGRQDAITEPGEDTMDMATTPTPPKQPRPTPSPTPSPNPKPGDKGPVR